MSRRNWTYPELAEAAQSLFDLSIEPRVWVDIRPSGAVWFLPQALVRMYQLDDEADYCD